MQKHNSFHTDSCYMSKGYSVSVGKIRSAAILVAVIVNTHALRDKPPLWSSRKTSRIYPLTVGRVFSRIVPRTQNYASFPKLNAET